MRAGITVRKLRKAPLEYDYQYHLASMLLTKLKQVNFELASELHASEDFKFYTFSGLRGKIIPVNKGLKFNSSKFILSSPDSLFIRSFSEGLLENPGFRLGKSDFTVTTVEIYPKKDIGKKERFETLSPVYLKTMREQDNHLVSWDLYPRDGKFYDNLHSNLVRRYEKFHGREPENDHFEARVKGKFKAKRIRIKGNMRRCSLFNFEAEGSPELLKFGYEAGFGEKTAMGFGCVETLQRV